MYRLITDIFGFQHELSTAFEGSHNRSKKRYMNVKGTLTSTIVTEEWHCIDSESRYFYVAEVFKTSRKSADFRDIITCMYSFLFVRYLVLRKQPKMQR
jgi:hypothetical protein